MNGNLIMAISRNFYLGAFTFNHISSILHPWQMQICKDSAS